VFPDENQLTCSGPDSKTPGPTPRRRDQDPDPKPSFRVYRPALIGVARQKQRPKPNEDRISKFQAQKTLSLLTFGAKSFNLRIRGLNAKCPPVDGGFFCFAKSNLAVQNKIF
jgi:hypothetical protein